MSALPVVVVCMKWGTAYDARYVNNLYRGVARHLSVPHRFVCLTDDTAGIDAGVECFDLPSMDLPPHKLRHGGWQKIGIFKRGLYGFEGVGLFLDLDVIIVGSLDALLRVSAGEMLAVSEWRKVRDYVLFWRERGANTSAFSFRFGEQCQIYDEFMAAPDAVMERFRIEQYAVSHFARGMRYFDKGLVRSFKRDCMAPVPLNWLLAPRLPRGARVIAFHGKPNPADVACGGRWGKGIKGGRGVVTWARRHWSALN